MILQAGGRSLEDLRELKGKRALMKLIGREQVPDADSVGDWLRRMGDPEKGQRGLPITNSYRCSWDLRFA